MFAVCELGGNAATCEIATGFPHQPTFSGQKEYFLGKKNISWAKNIFEQKDIISAQNKDVLWWTIRRFIQNFVESQVNQVDISDYTRMQERVGNETVLNDDLDEDERFDRVWGDTMTNLKRADVCVELRRKWLMEVMEKPAAAAAQ